MKKVLILLTAGMLGATSCTEQFEPSVDYGDQTYINDYSTLVSVINDLNKSISERFEALNTLLDKNMVDIKLSLNENSGAIKVLGESVDAINSTLFDGFSALSTQIDAVGNRIVYAINENGELLRLEIDKTGKLISAQIDMSVKELVETINSLSTNLSEKFDALTAVVNAGFAEVSVKIDEQSNMLDVQLTDVNTNLETLNTTMFEGFEALHTAIDENGDKIVTAINENGEILRLQIDETGKLILAEIQKSADALVKVIDSQTATIGEKFDALTGMIKTGFADITTQIGEVGEQLHLDIKGVNTTIGNGFTTLGVKIDANSNTIATAINEQGEKLELAIDNNGKVVSAEIKDFKGAYETAAAKELAKMGEVLGAIKDLKDANNTNAANLVEKLEQLLSDNGIYFDENNRQQLYMTPENYAAVQDAGESSALYKLYADQLDVLTITFNNKQVVNATGEVHTHAIFTPNTSADATPLLVASRAEVVDGIANGKKVMKVVRTAIDRNYTITISNECDYRYIFGVRLTDAKNTNAASTFNPIMTHNLKLTVYDKSTNVIQNNIHATVYCNDGGATYDITDL